MNDIPNKKFVIFKCCGCGFACNLYLDLYFIMGYIYTIIGLYIFYIIILGIYIYIQYLHEPWVVIVVDTHITEFYTYHIILYC